MAEKTRLTNAGKKEQRQFDQVLDKAVKQGTFERDGQTQDVESRTIPKQHSTHKQKNGK